jgi:hypothetical protein
MPKTATRQKRCDASGRANAGSQKQIQFYVNEEPTLLNRAIEDAFGRQLGLRWVSPLKADHYEEYKDLQFLATLGMSRYGQKLSAFWPKGGPRWDALARVESGAGGVLLVEAKSHIPEMYAGECKATSSTSLQMIDASIELTKSWLGVDAAVKWRGRYQYYFSARMRTGCLYQMANRIAHLYFFREVLGIDAWFVNLYFVDDPHSRTTQMEWELGLAEAKKSMGIAAASFAADVFLSAAG